MKINAGRPHRCVYKIGARSIAIVGIVVDISKLSLSKLDNLLAAYIDDISSFAERDNITVVVFGNKSDLPREEISNREFEECVKKYGCLPAIVSAKTGEGIEEAFYDATQSQLIKMGAIVLDNEKEKDSKSQEKPSNQGRCNMM